MSRNRLAAETSPYLRQHADNPVDWYPWGPEALAAARNADRPILLSIGYSACHWCHVMAHESFEDAGIAAQMNRDFINIKVDREERPDLDKIYQTAQQLLTQRSGGWPLTMFLSPEDQRPFFGGTYFPKESQRGLPGFADLLTRVTQYFATQRAAIDNQNEQLVASLARLAASGTAASGAATTLDDTPLLSAGQALERAFDREYGGFGGAPKFPQTSSIERCLLQWYSSSGSPTPDLQALYMATLTLTRMAEGGIYDQLAGGFARYSTDARWMIPHFEKMLYDNGLLLSLYAAAHRATGEPLFARIAADTADWLLRDMQSADGGFFSSLDADSAAPAGTSHEGIYYVWTREEASALLSPDEYDIVAWRYGLDREPNFEGRWHLHVRESLDQLNTQSGESPAALLDTARAKLLEARNERSAPARDEKILTSWNALAIKGLALTGRVLGRPDLSAAATAAVDVIRATLWRGGRLLATAKDGRAHLNAYLDDYAFLAAALLELLQSRWRSSDLKWAQELVGVLMTQFADAEHGGFFFTAADHETLIQRTKTFSDDSLPAGNGVAAAVLTRLGLLLGDLGMLHAAERTLQAGQPLMLEYPLGHMTMINAQAEFLASTQIILIRGAADEVARWATQLDALYAPTRMVLAIPSDATDLPAAIADKPAIDGLTTAYVCTGMTCAPPVHDLESLARLAAANLASAQRITHPM